MKMSDRPTALRRSYRRRDQNDRMPHMGSSDPAAPVFLIHAGKDRLPLDPEFWPLLERVPDHLLTASGLVIGKVRVSCLPALDDE